MPRLPLLIAAAAAAFLAHGAAAGPTNAHFDPTKFPRPCSPCHRGHGAPGTPRLTSGTGEFCLKCHESAAKNAVRKAALGLGAAANPADIRSELTKPVSHARATCFDCHSAHASEKAPVSGFPNLSPKRSFRFESDLCLSCHGTRGAQGADPLDLSKLLAPTNPSFHPVLAAGRAAAAPGLLPPWSSTSLLNCTDCHTNDDPSGPRGPHGSHVLKLLGKACALTDGQTESAATYALCYSCHDRASILGSATFPEHREHVVDQRISCVSCHDAHGATASRALIRFNEPVPGAGVTPSSSGRLEFLSSAAGRGTCFLTCHGKNHDPLTYGGGALGRKGATAPSSVRPARPQAVPAPGRPEPRRLP